MRQLTDRQSKPSQVRREVEGILAELAEGDAVPAERELALRFGVARETVRVALAQLLLAGRIERRGRGTVVARPKLVQPLSLKSYTEGAITSGRAPGRIPVGFDEVAADAVLADGLAVGRGEPVIHLERVLLADAARIGLESTYLPRHRFGWLAESFDPTTSLYAALRAAGVVFGTAVERIETMLPSPREAALLGSTTSTPMLLLHRRTTDSDGEPIEVVRALYRGDRVAFEATLTDR